MELKLGYKQTEVGVIPEEWEVKLLPDVCRFRSGKAHEQFISETGRYVCVNSKFISSDGRVRKNCTANFSPAKKGDVLMVMSDLPNGRALAKAYLVEVNDLYAVNQRVCVLSAYRDYPKYLFYILNRNPYFLKFDDGVNQTHLLNHVFKKCPLPIPRDVAEQRAIGTVLSEVDALLAELNRLIKKKRDLKQAAMQRLLTGRTRLPGFSAPWCAKPLGELAEIVSGGTPRTSEASFWNGSVKWCTPTDITGCNGKYLTETARSISRLGLKSSGARLLPAGTLLLCSRATIGELKIASGEVCTNQGFKSLICHPGVSNEFLYYKLLTMKQQMLERAFGSTFLEISKANVAALEISMPGFPEQIAIAASLSDMDTELVAMEGRRDKTRDLKRALMQELLTGKTRLIATGVAHA